MYLTGNYCDNTTNSNIFINYLIFIFENSKFDGLILSLSTLSALDLKQLNT